MKRKLTVLLLVAAMIVTGLSGCKAKEAGTKKFKVGITIQSLENSYWAGVFGEVKKNAAGKRLGLYDFVVKSQFGYKNRTH